MKVEIGQNLGTFENNNKRGGPMRFPFVFMEIGDFCFVTPYSRDIMSSSLTSANNACKRRNLKYKFSGKKINSGMLKIIRIS